MPGPTGCERYCTHSSLYTGTRGRTAPHTSAASRFQAHQRRARSCRRCTRAHTSCTRRHTIMQSPATACGVTASHTVGSVRGLRTGGGGELARSPATSRRPSVMVPSIESTCGRPSCSCAQVCRVGAAGPARLPGRTQISSVRPSLRTGSSRGEFVGAVESPPLSRARVRRCLRRRRVLRTIAASCSH